jgi:predicted nucleotidyltransferase
MIAAIPERIADALFPQVRQRLFAALFGQPQRSFYTNELVRLAGSGSGVVQRELASLAECGLLLVERRGNQKHYQANSDAPVFAELGAIVRKTFGVAGVLRAALAPLAARIDQAFVYGSVAAGSQQAESDIDVMIVADDLTLEEVFAVLQPAVDSLARPINPTLYTRGEFRKRIATKNPFLTKVLARPRIPLIGGDHGTS